MTDEIREMCDDILEYEFRSSELIQDLVRDNPVDVVEDEMLDAIKELLGRVEDPERVMTCYMLAYQIGRAMESQRIIDFAEDGVNSLKGK